MDTVALHHKLEGKGPKIALLHPVGLDLTFFAPMAAALAKDFCVLSVDLRGHGRSPMKPAPRGLADYVDDVHALFEVLSFAPAAVAGFSFGGMIAQMLAATYPRDVSALIPCATPGTLPPEERPVARDRADQAERGGMQAVLEATLDRWFTPAFRQRSGDAAARERLLSDDPAAWAAAWRAISGLDALPHLRSVRVPALCIAGELDRSSPPPAVKAIADAIPGARFTVLHGAPHMLFVEQPEAAARVIRDFLTELPALSA